MRTGSERVPIRVLIGYLLLFFAAWTASELLLVPRLTGLSPLAFTLVRDVGLKCLIWLLPALVLIRRYNEALALPRPFRRPGSWLPWLGVMAIFAGLLAAGSLVRNHGLSLASGFGLDDVLWLLFVGLCEEGGFRGWLLNAMIGPEGRGDLPWRPVALTSVLFLLIHFPFWYRTGDLVSNLTGGAFLSILVLSVLFSWSFWKSRTLIVPIVLHSAWDLLVTLLVS